ncbi:VWA domain-containing protein [Paracoccus sp. ME4]|uniref:VWA domain-containing protein n=1 Tax=Paracoccus sp. ME4 TaxID=3138066 RepID=UPI00398B373D
MKHLAMGANMALDRHHLTVRISTGPGADICVLQTYADGKVRGDDDMCFYNQPEIAGGGVVLSAADGTGCVIGFKLERVGEDVTKLIVAVTLDGAGRSFSQLAGMGLSVDGLAMFDLPLDGRQEAALILAEIYRHNGNWKLRNVCQGFNGGLGALATHFGIEVAAEEPAAAAGPKVTLEKKLVSLEKAAPELVSLVKKAGVSLAKNNVSQPRAKMVLALDISGSMSRLYRSGKVDTLVRRVMAMGYVMDDDGDIDVFLFGRGAYQFGSVDVTNYARTVARVLKKHPLEGGTRYGDMMEKIRKHYARKGRNDESLPVFVMFVTDGGTDDKRKTEAQLVEASYEPLFWKFMAIQEGGGRWDAQRFDFLQKLDDLPGRLIDNADAFSLSDPAAPSDEEMFDLMMTEYQGWLAAARREGLVTV